MKKKTVSILVWIVSAVIAVTVGIFALTEECAHVYTDWEIVTEATCAREGEKVRRCTRCNEEETKPVDKKAHVVDNKKTEIQEPTCTQDGLITTYCKNCKGVIDKPEKIDKLGHNYVRAESYDCEPTCTEVGKENTKVCDRCGDEQYTSIPKLGHDWEQVDALAATCTSSGYTAHEACKRDGCDAKRGGYEFIPMHMSTTKVIPSVKATCTENGSTEGLKCSECDIWLVRPEVIDAAHDLKDDGWEITKKATCNAVGSKEQTCGVCQTKVQEEIAMTGHNFNTLVSAKQPTCTEAGYTRHKICDNCGVQDSSYQVVSITSHNFEKTTGICKTCQTNIFTFELRGDSYWLIDVNKKVITKTNDLYDLTVPMLHEGKNVVGIGYGAAKNCTFIRSIELPATVVTIEDSAFENCSNLKTVNLDGVKSIGRSAFEACTALKTVELSSEVAEIGISAFDGCTSLSELTAPFLGTAYEAGNTFGEIFGGNKYVPESLKTVTVLKLYDNVIPANAFKDMYAVQTIKLPQGVVGVGASAFEGCSSLSAVLIGSNDSNEFKGVTSIGEKAFKGSMITTVTLPFLGESETATENKTIFHAFGEAKDITVKNVTVLAGTEIAEEAFAEVLSLESVTLPKETEKIGASAFNGCSKLTTVNHASVEKENYLPNTVTEIGSLAFAGTKLTEITLPFIGDGTGKYVNIGYVFGDNGGMPETLKKVQILKSAQTSVSMDAFKNCKYLEEITLPENILSIETGAFDGCRKLKAVHSTKEENGELIKLENTLPTALTALKAKAFYATGLTKLIVPESVVEMGVSVFDGCTSLVELTVPFLGATINEAEQLCYLFSGDNSSVPSSLKTVTVLGGKKVAESAFAGCSNLTSIVISNETEIIERYAFQNCSALTEFVAPESVKYIKSFAFDGCVALSKLTLPFVGMTELDKDEQGEDVVIGQRHFGYIFDGDSTTVDQNASIPTSLKTVVLTKATNIFNQAFYGCTSIVKVSLPSTLTSLGSEVFKGCTALEEVEFVKVENVDWTLTTISDGAFALCSSLKKMVLPASVEEIGELAFGSGPADSGKACVALEEIYTDGYDSLRVKKIGYQAFMSSFVAGAEIKIEGLEEMRAEAFCYSNIGSLEISGVLTEILSMSFYGCKYLETAVIPASVKKLEANAFRNNPLMYKVVSDKADLENGEVSFKLPNVSEICAYAFRDCIALTGKVEFNSEVWIGGSAFENCTGITEVVFNAQEGKTTIGKDAFSGCTNLEWVYLNYKNVNEAPNGGVSELVESGVVSIGDYAFKNCGSTLKSVNGEKQFLKVFVGFESEEIGQTKPNWSKYWLMGAKVGDGNSYTKVADYQEYLTERNS